MEPRKVHGAEETDREGDRSLLSPIVLFDGIVGSRLYGTNIEGSDTDKGIVLLEPWRNLVGVRQTPDLSQVIVDGLDTQRHWLRRFVSLVLKGNPNVLEWLYVNPENSTITPEMDALMSILALECLHIDPLRESHLGFAKSQFIRMVKFDGNWGAKRKELYHSYGYDIKFASHAIRLLHQLNLLLTEGRITFPYPQRIRDEVVLIKTGKVSLRDVQELYQDYEKSLLLLLEDHHPLINSGEATTDKADEALIDLERKLSPRI